MSSKTFPTTDFERALLADARFIVAIDEVGRGALAGPVAVGAVLIDRSTNLSEHPAKLQDSKLMTQVARESIQTELKNWVVLHSVGTASSAEIDELGIVIALSAAASRALEDLLSRHSELEANRSEARIILDGTHDWLSAAGHGLPVVMRAKADRDCASVAAASVLAKVHRDQIMVDFDKTYPGYGFSSHKGYGAASHIEAIRRLGASAEHRKTWLSKILDEGVLPGLENTEFG